MTSQFGWQLEDSPEGVVVRLSGFVDEDTDFNPLARDLDGKKVVTLDLSGVKRINSCGVREWMRFMRDLSGITRFAWQRCSPVIVAQLNLVANFAGSAQIGSVMAPFACDECGREEQKEIVVSTAVQPVLGEHYCSVCGEEMAFDELEETYFAFLRHVGAR